MGAGVLRRSPLPTGLAGCGGGSPLQTALQHLSHGVKQRSATATQKNPANVPFDVKPVSASALQMLFNMLTHVSRKAAAPPVFMLVPGSVFLLSLCHFASAFASYCRVFHPNCFIPQHHLCLSFLFYRTVLAACKWSPNENVRSSR